MTRFRNDWRNRRGEFQRMLDEQAELDAQVSTMEAEGAPAVVVPEPPPPAPPKPFSMHCYLCDQTHTDEKQWSEHLSQWAQATRKKKGAQSNG